MTRHASRLLPLILASVLKYVPSAEPRLAETHPLYRTEGESLCP